MYSSSVYRDVAELHVANIGQGFLPTLGVPFLTLLYEAIDEDPSSVLIVALRSDNVVGFVTGSCGLGPIYKRLMSSPLRLISALLPSVFSLSKLRKIVEIVFLNREAESVTKETLPRAELLSIVVDPTLRGSGYAQQLYRDLCAHFRAAGEGRFQIVVGDELEPAHRFYRKMGAEVVGRCEVHKGQGSTVYVYVITS